MSVRNHNWYSLQATRRYPLDENSTGLDDARALMRDDIIVDCHIRFPNTYGAYVYIQGITVSPGIVTLVFGCAGAIGGAVGEPLAFVSGVKPLSQNINYSITGLKPGVSGWVVFGSGIETNFMGRYSTAEQTLISPRCARAYTPLPVPTIGKLGAQASLQGVVKLLGNLPVRVRYAANAGPVVAPLNGAKLPYKENVSALIVELDPAQITENYNPLQLFLGPCGQRPESGTCPKTPIESINGIAPDCAGNINIVFENFGATHLFKNCGGIDIVSNNDLTDICDAANPRKNRKTYTDACCVANFELATEAGLATFPAAQRKPYIVVKTLDTAEHWRLAEDLVTWKLISTGDDCAWPDPTELIPDIIIDEITPNPHGSVDIPACVDFDSCGSVDKFTTRAGSFSTSSRHAPGGCPGCTAAELNVDVLNTIASDRIVKPVYTAEPSAALNIATFNNASTTDWANNKTTVVEVQIGSAGIAKAAGLVLNYQNNLNEAQTPQTTFVAVVLDANRGQIRVLRYTNGAITVENTTTMRITDESWYRLSATPIATGAGISLNVYAEEMTATNKATAYASVQIDANAYGRLDGAVGVIAIQSAAWFNKFAIYV